MPYLGSGEGLRNIFVISFNGIYPVFTHFVSYFDTSLCLIKDASHH